MMAPVVNTWRKAIPTGVMLDPYVHGREMAVKGRNPLAGFSGIGAGPTTTQLESLAATGASTTVSLLTAFSVIGGPVGAAISAGIGVALAVAQFFKGCGQTCIQASNDANKLEPYLQQNVQAYLSSPIRTTSMQAAALNNFDTIWNALVQACSDPQLQAAGQRCITDRHAGACTWKASASGWVKNADGSCTYTAAGPAGSGDTCWNWFVGYRSPIADDPCVVPDSVLQQMISGQSSTSNTNTADTGSPAPQSSVAQTSAGVPSWLILGGAGLLLLALVNEL